MSILFISLALLSPSTSRPKPRTSTDAVRSSDLEGVLKFQNRQKKDVRIFTWRGRPRVFILSFRTSALQGRALNRIAAFVEKKGVRGKVLTSKELNDYIKKTGSTPANFYAAHDYRGKALAQFFNQARKRRIALNEGERFILRFLLKYKIIRGNRKYRGGSRAIISLPGDYSIRTRRVLIRHEARHALFFTNVGYRRICRAHWQRLTARDRAFLRRLFASMNYDPADEYLMANEFQSYILQEDQPLEKYLARRARKKEGAYIRAYLRRYPGRISRLRSRLRRGLRAYQLR